MTTTLQHRIGTFEHTLPPTFIDSSYGNDICPSIYSKALQLKIFIDHVDPLKREEPSYARFGVYKTNELGETEGSLLESEHWEDVLNFIQTVAAL